METQYQTLTDADELQPGDQFDLGDGQWIPFDTIGLDRFPRRVRERKQALITGQGQADPAFWQQNLSRLRYRRPIVAKQEWVCGCRNLRNDVGHSCYWCGKTEQQKF